MAAAAKYRLRPIPHVHTGSPSLLSSTTASSGSECSPTSASSSKQCALLPPNAAQLRRPLSPLSPLRDLKLSPMDVSVGPADVPHRGRFPALPTGHELMALFPPPPPPSFTTGSTSRFFFKEERAFFAREGKEIVAVQIEVDMHAPPPQRPDHRPTTASPRAHALAPPPPLLQQRARARSAPAPLPYPAHAHTHSQHHAPPPAPQAHPHPHVRTTLPHAAMDVPIQYAMNPPYLPQAQEHSSKKRPAHAEGLGEEDETWRRPMLHSKRRHVGKHTKRVIVK